MPAGRLCAQHCDGPRDDGGYADEHVHGHDGQEGQVGLDGISNPPMLVVSVGISAPSCQLSPKNHRVVIRRQLDLAIQLKAACFNRGNGLLGRQA